MLTQYLDQLNQYSNLILIAVTTAYVILTWWMVREMRRAREAESEPHLIATPMPFGSLNVILRIHNAGRGPALSIKAVIRLEATDDTLTSTWLHPVLLSGAYEDLFFPGSESELEKLASRFDRAVVDLEWCNAFKRKTDTRQEINLKQLKEGWSGGGFILHPNSIPLQLSAIKDELTRIRDYLGKPEEERTAKEFIKQYKRKRSFWYKFWRKIIVLLQSPLHRKN